MTAPHPSPSPPCLSQGISTQTLSAVNLTAEKLAAESRTAPGPHLLLFDGVCPMCHGAVRLLLRLDRRGLICFAPLQGETARRIAKRHQIGLDLSTAIYVRNLCARDERLHFESSAVLRALADTGSLLGLLVSLARVVPRPLRNLAYRFVARRRFRWFTPYDSCPLPRPEDAARFLP